MKRYTCTACSTGEEGTFTFMVEYTDAPDDKASDRVTRCPSCGRLTDEIAVKEPEDPEWVEMEFE